MPSETELNLSEEQKQMLEEKDISEDEVGECISEKVEEEGMDQDQAVAICLSELESGSSEPEEMNAEEREERMQEVIENRDQIQRRNFQITGKEVELVKNEEEDKGDVAINVPIQAISEDRDGDIITEQGQDDIIRQLRTGTVPLMLNHGIGSNPAIYDVRDIVGQFVDGDKEQGTTMGVARMRKKPESEELTEDAKEIVDLLKQDMPIGFSVGFIPKDVDEKEDGGNEIKNLDLMEVSAVGIPSNPEAVPQAMGTAAQMAKNAGLSENEIMQTVKSAFNNAMSNKDEQPYEGANTTENNDSKSEEEQNVKQVSDEQAQEIMSVLNDAVDSMIQDVQNDLESMVEETDEMDEEEEDDDKVTDEDEDEDEEEMNQEPEEENGSDHTEDDKSSESADDESENKQEKEKEEIESTADKNKQEDHSIEQKEEQEENEEEKEVDEIASIAAENGEMWG